MSGRVFGYTFGRVPTWLLDAEVSDRAVRLFALLTRYADQETQDFPGRRALAERLRCSVDSIDRALRELVAAGAVRIEERWDVDGAGGQLTNDYHLLEHRHEGGPQPCGPPSRTGAAPPGRMHAAPPAAPVRLPIEREPEEPDSYPDSGNPAARASQVTAAILASEPPPAHGSPPRPPSPGTWVDPAVLSAAIDEAAKRVGESDLARTAAALYGIALHESEARPTGDPLRAVATAYARGAAEAVDEAQTRRHRPSCAPVRDLPALAFHIARRQLVGEGPPPWPERPPRPSAPAPPAHIPSRRAPTQGTAPRVTPGPLPPTQAAEDVSCSAGPAAWDTLDPARRAAAEALVWHEQPELTRWTQARGPVWQAAVRAAAGRLTRTEDVTPAATQQGTPLTTSGHVLTQEDVL